MTDETYKRARKEAKKQPKRKHFPLNAPYSVIYRTPLKKKFSKDFRAKVIKQNFFSSFASCFFQKILFPNDSPHFFSENLTRSCKRPSTHFFMKRPENMKHEFNARACLKTSKALHFVFEHESRDWNLEREWSESRERCKRSERSERSEWSESCEWSERSEWSESCVTFVTNETNETNVTNVTNVKQEMAIGGEATRHSCKPLQKSNNFESIFGDSTLTLLTYRNTFRLPILPIRRIIFLCLPLIKIRRRQILLRCAPNFTQVRS